MLLEEITSFVRTVEPASEPVTLSEAKAQLRIDGSDEDAYITSLIAVARDHAEDVTGLALMDQTWKVVIDSGALPDDGIIELPRPPLQSITGISYIDTDGASQTLASSYYTLDTTSHPGRLLFEDMPAIKDTINALVITYVAGYADADAVPPAIKQGILLLVSHWFEFREPVVMGMKPERVPLAAETLLRSKRLHWL